MRIIAGKFKGLNIKTINDPSTRPMMSRAREGIFNSLQNDFNNSLVLDLFKYESFKHACFCIYIQLIRAVFFMLYIQNVLFGDNDSKQTV